MNVSWRHPGRSGAVLYAVLAAIMGRLGFVPVARGGPDAAHSLAAAAAALAAGEAVGLYPEGRITCDPNMWPERAKTGAVPTTPTGCRSSRWLDEDPSRDRRRLVGDLAVLPADRRCR